MGLVAASGLLLCPVCQRDLDLVPSTAPGTSQPVAARCGSGHHFDVARSGVLNLLRRPPPAHADSAQQVAARQRAHASGAFEPIADALAGRAIGPVRLEAGAGPAYYLARQLSREPRPVGIALDISTAAARAAARAHPLVASVVADVWERLPIRDQGVTTVINVFAPRHLEEYARVLAPGGRLLVVVPNAGHLGELRDRYELLGIHPDKVPRLVAAAPAELAFNEAVQLTYTWAADADLVRDLIAMGPNGFYRHDHLVTDASVTIDVTLLAWDKVV
jgi:23S rRNA (guanine745-N1)-methyltransferase